MNVLAAGLFDRNDIADLDLIRRNIDPLSVYLDVSVTDELAGGIDSSRKTGAKHYGIKTTFELLNEYLASVALFAAGTFKVIAHLPFGNVVLKAKPLLF